MGPTYQSTPQLGGLRPCLLLLHCTHKGDGRRREASSNSTLHRPWSSWSCRWCLWRKALPRGLHRGWRKAFRTVLQGSTIHRKQQLSQSRTSLCRHGSRQDRWRNHHRTDTLQAQQGCCLFIGTTPRQERQSIATPLPAYTSLSERVEAVWRTASGIREEGMWDCPTEPLTWCRLCWPDTADVAYGEPAGDW